MVETIHNVVPFILMQGPDEKYASGSLVMKTRLFWYLLLVWCATDKCDSSSWGAHYQGQRVKTKNTSLMEIKVEQRGDGMGCICMHCQTLVLGIICQPIPMQTTSASQSSQMLLEEHYGQDFAMVESNQEEKYCSWSLLDKIPVRCTEYSFKHSKRERRWFCSYCRSNMQQI